MENKSTQKSRHDEKNWLEWLVFCISLLLLLGILGYLVYEVSNYKPTDPDVYAIVKPDPSEHAPNRYQVTIANKGGTTAEEVMVEFILYRAGKEIEKSELMIAFSPKDSEKQGWINFSGKPEKADSVATRVVSFKKP